MSPRRPTRATAERLAQELHSRINGRYVDKLWRTAPDEVMIRFAGQTRRLLIHVSIELTTLGWIPHWPETPSSPDFETIQLRTHLEGGRVSRVALVDDRRLVISLTRGDGPRELSVQLSGRFPNLAAFAEEQQLGVALKQDRPGRDEGAPTLPEGPCLLADEQGDWLEAHGELCLESLARAALDRHRVRVARIARAWRKRTQRSFKAVSRDLSRAEGAEQDRVFGELLKSALGRIRKGAPTVRLVDYTQPDAPEIDVPLEPALGPVENMQRYFRRYRKYRDAAEPIRARLAMLEARIMTTDDILASIADASSDDELQAAETALRGTGWRPPRPQRTSGKASAPPPPYRRFLAIDGTEILLGRGSKHNDELTFHVARGRDLWFHARDTPGAHVILRCPRNGSPSHEAMLDAATLAGWHSKAKADAIIDVTWTERKHVRKPKGAPPGRVTVADSRNIAVRMDQARIDRLYANAPDE